VTFGCRVNQADSLGFEEDLLARGAVSSPHEQADLVASIEKVARLRIVGRTHDVAMEVLAQDVGVLSLNASGHGLTCKRKCLVTVQSA